MHSIRLLSVVALTAAAAVSACQTASPLLRAGAQPDTALMLRDVRYLASDALEGRGSGTPGNDSARAYIARRFAELKLRPALAESGCASMTCATTFVQPFTARMSGAERHGLGAALPTANLAAIIEGKDPAVRGQIVILGAHYDHLGRQAFGARDPNLPNAIRNGADDNASGVAAVLELARLLRRNPPKRSVAILTFSAEELGLLGSEYFVNHTPFPLDSVQAMLNFDMVGRLRDDKLMVFGTATAKELGDIVTAANGNPGFKLNAVGDGEGPSDHAAFYRKDLPVLHFFTDAHEDYHMSTDDAEKINGDGMRRVVAYAERIAREVADRPERLTFVRAPAKVSRTGPARQAGPQPWLGTVPDMGASDEPGLRLSGVTAGSPAEQAGLKTGDLVVELGGAKVVDLQSYSEALYSRKPGEVIEVVVRRGTERLTFSVTLGQRGG